MQVSEIHIGNNVSCRYYLDFSEGLVLSEEGEEEAHLFRIVGDALIETNPALEGKVKDFVLEEEGFESENLRPNEIFIDFEVDASIGLETIMKNVNDALPNLSVRLKKAGFKVAGGWGDFILSTPDAM